MMCVRRYAHAHVYAYVMRRYAHAQHARAHKVLRRYAHAYAYAYVYEAIV